MTGEQGALVVFGCAVVAAALALAVAMMVAGVLDWLDQQKGRRRES